jgi:hypothetical protein
MKPLMIPTLVLGGLALIVIFYCGALFIANDGNRDFLAIDSCLDSGGKWNYTTRTCEH